MHKQKKVCLEYFDKHPEAKREMIEKGYKLFPNLAPKNNIDIEKIIKKEEENYFELLKRAEKIVKKLKVEEISGELLCKLHHTHGIDPLIVEDILKIELPNKLHDDYLVAYEKHKQTGKEGIIK